MLYILYVQKLYGTFTPKVGLNWILYILGFDRHYCLWLTQHQRQESNEHQTSDFQ